MNEIRYQNLLNKVASQDASVDLLYKFAALNAQLRKEAAAGRVGQIFRNVIGAVGNQANKLTKDVKRFKSLRNTSKIMKETGDAKGAAAASKKSWKALGNAAKNPITVGSGVAAAGTAGAGAGVAAAKSKSKKSETKSEE